MANFSIHKEKASSKVTPLLSTHKVILEVAIVPTYSQDKDAFDFVNSPYKDKEDTLSSYSCHMAVPCNLEVVVHKRAFHRSFPGPCLD